MSIREVFVEFIMDDATILRQMENLDRRLDSIVGRFQRADELLSGLGQNREVERSFDRQTESLDRMVESLREFARFGTEELDKDLQVNLEAMTERFENLADRLTDLNKMILSPKNIEEFSRALTDLRENIVNPPEEFGRFFDVDLMRSLRRERAQEYGRLSDALEDAVRRSYTEVGERLNVAESLYGARETTGDLIGEAVSRPVANLQSAPEARQDREEERIERDKLDETEKLSEGLQELADVLQELGSEELPFNEERFETDIPGLELTKFTTSEATPPLPFWEVETEGALPELPDRSDTQKETVKEVTESTTNYIEINIPVKVEKAPTEFSEKRFAQEISRELAEKIDEQTKRSKTK